MKTLLLLFSIIFLFGCFGRRPPIKTGLEGKSLPSFPLLLTDSTTYLNTKNIPEGKPIVLFYFGPNCPYSRSQMEAIIDNMKLLKHIRFYVFTTWPWQEMKMFYNYYQLKKYQNITVGIDYTNYFSDYFKAEGVPYIAIYNKNKKLNEAFIGKIDGRQIKEIAK